MGGALVALLIAGSCGEGAIDTSGVRWVRVIQDPNYIIYLDTAMIRHRPDQSYRRVEAYEVLYRTDHALPRELKGKTFTREVVRSIVLCDSLWFRVASVDMSMGDGKPVAIQRLEDRELARQAWRRVGMGTSEEVAARAACHFIGDRARARVPTSR
jgi:hypothetical protein